MERPTQHTQENIHQLDIFTDAYFDGDNYGPKFDQERLTGQLKRIYSTMIDGVWRTLKVIKELKLTKDGQSSISAQLRHLRKKRFGSHNKRSRGERKNGLYDYQVLPWDSQ